MTENYKIDHKFTQKEMDYYNERITIRLVSDVLSLEENKKSWMIICKKCNESLIPFRKNIEKEPVDRALKEHQCKKIITNGAK